jgi:hypothetical protein
LKHLSLQTPGFTWNYEAWIGTYKIWSWSDENATLWINDSVRVFCCSIQTWVGGLAQEVDRTWLIDDLPDLATCSFNSSVMPMINIVFPLPRDAAAEMTQ